MNNYITNNILHASKPLNYQRIAKMWSIVLDKDVKAKEVALCVSQLYTSGLIDNPDNLNLIIPMAENLFKYEALSQETFNS